MGGDVLGSRLSGWWCVGLTLECGAMPVERLGPGHVRDDDAVADQRVHAARRDGRAAGDGARRRQQGRRDTVLAQDAPHDDGGRAPHQHGRRRQGCVPVPPRWLTNLKPYTVCHQRASSAFSFERAASAQLPPPAMPSSITVPTSEQSWASLSLSHTITTTRICTGIACLPAY
eukprot:1143312-Rhodomonas_salina.5